MSLTFLDSFDDGFTPYRGWGTIGNTIATMLANGASTSRNGGGAIRMTTGDTAAITPAAHAKVGIGFAWMSGLSAVTASRVVSLRGDAGATEHAYVTALNGVLSFVVKGVTVYTHPTAIVLSQWVHVAVYYELHDTLGVYDLQLDGVSVATASAFDTKNAGTLTTIDSFYFIGTNSRHNTWDDMFVFKNDGTGLIALPGDCAIEAKYPNGDGATSQLVGSDGDSVNNYLLVDDAAVTTDYVESDVVGNLDVYAMTDLTRTAGTIYGVGVSALGIRSDAGTRGMKPELRSGGTTYDGPETMLSNVTQAVSGYWDVDPATGVAWTFAGVNAVQAGLKVSS
jgi:hypothetical protein